MNTMVLDFETYFSPDFSLRRLTIPQYVHDPRFHVHGLALRYPDGHCEFRTDVADAIAGLQTQFGPQLDSVTVVGHHLAFDLYVLSKHFGLIPRFFVDTYSLATHVHGRARSGGMRDLSLKALADRHHLPCKGELEFMEGVRHPSVQQLADLASYARRDVEITDALLERLLPQISRPEIELRIMMHTIRMFVERQIWVDLPVLDALEQQITQETEQSLAQSGSSREIMAGGRSFAAVMTEALEPSGRGLPMKPGKKGLIPALAKTDADMQALVEDEDRTVATLARTRLGVKAESLKLARVRRARAIVSATGGYIPPFLRYYGAHTGRFAGGGGFNLQNLGTRGLGSMFRRTLVARPNHVLVIGDLSKIEARIIAWIAGCDLLLSAFRENRDVYSEFAAQTFHIPVHKPRDSDPPDIRKQMEGPYQIGKAAVLGLGFGMGALKFMDQLKSRPETARLFPDGTLSPAVCREIVGAYRTAYPQIPQFWKDLETAAREAAVGIACEADGLRFDVAADVTRLWLPSGRALRYPRLRLETKLRTIRYLADDGTEAEFTPVDDALIYDEETALYGGKITENVVQAVARDLLVETILRLEDRGLPVLLHVHDEIVLEVPSGHAQSARDALPEELCRPPAWAPTLPLDAEVPVSPHYTK